MPRFDWKYGYETNNKTVDLQHKYFLDLMNRLYDELAETSDKIYQERLLDEIICYAKFHFISEENILLKHLPENFERQKRLHEILINELSSKIQSMRSGDLHPREIVQFVVEWFYMHTITEDLTDFLPLA